MREKLKKYGTIVEAWIPLVAGANNIFSKDILVKIGNKYGKSPAQIVLQFLVQNVIVIIPKTRQKDRMIENIICSTLNSAMMKCNYYKLLTLMKASSVV